MWVGAILNHHHACVCACVRTYAGTLNASAKVPDKSRANEYLYRYVALNRQLKNGVFTVDEERRFVALVRKYGAGSMWGWFASHFGTRVGYTCSAFYRKLIARGVVIDDRFQIDRDTGAAVWFGSK